MSQPYYLVKRGKVWYYRLANERTYHSTGETVESHAHSKAAVEYRLRGLSSSSGVPLAVYQRPYYTEHCPHCARLADEKKPINERWRRMRRGCLDRLADDPIMKKTVDRLTAGDFFDLRARLRAATFYNNGRRKSYMLSDAAINRHIGALKTVVKEAFLRRDISMDPTAGVGKIKTHAEPTGVYSVDELRALICREHWTAGSTKGNGKYPELAPFVYAWLAATTGARPDSILSARWKDLDGDVWNLQKVKTSPYSIPLLQETQDLLEELRDQAVRIAAEDLVLCYESGRPFGQTWVRGRWLDAVSSACLEADSENGRRTPYSLKHSLITALLNAGADELLVREYVGHSHGSGRERILTPAQRHYYRGASTEQLRDSILPLVRRICLG